VTTARDILTLAFKEAGVLGVGQTLLAEDVNDGFTYLRRMMQQWQKKRWLIPGLTTVSALGNDLKSNTIGPGGHWDYPIRPDKIQSAYMVQQNTGQTPVSIPLRLIFAKEDYDRITLKDLNTYPGAVFYDNLWTGGVGNVYVWPIPSATYRIYLTIKTDLGWPGDIDSDFDLPLEYEEAIHYNLALRLCSGYQLQPQDETKRLARASLNTIKVSNTQVPRLQMPASLLGTNRGFNIFNPDSL
jgi:hypothetical protein